MVPWVQALVVSELSRAYGDATSDVRERVAVEVATALDGLPRRTLVALRLSLAHGVTIDALARMLATDRTHALQLLDGARLTIVLAARTALDGVAGRMEEATREL